MSLRVALVVSGLAVLAGPAGAATVVSVGDGDTLCVREGGRLLTFAWPVSTPQRSPSAPMGPGPGNPSRSSPPCAQR